MSYSFERYPRSIVLDVDETLLNSAQKHYQELYKIAVSKGETKIPTYLEFLAAGGSHGSFGHFDWYQEENQRMVADEKFNLGLEPIEGAQEATTVLAPLILGYLTTRPDVINHISKADLLANGFPDRPLVARPPHIHNGQTVPWKISQLRQMADTTGQRLLMIDDNAKLYEALKSMNSDMVKGILLDGPMTKHDEALSWREVLALMSLYL